MKVIWIVIRVAYALEFSEDFSIDDCGYAGSVIRNYQYLNHVHIGEKTRVRILMAIGMAKTR